MIKLLKNFFHKYFGIILILIGIITIIIECLNKGQILIHKTYGIYLILIGSIFSEIIDTKINNIK